MPQLRTLVLTALLFSIVAAPAAARVRPKSTHKPHMQVSCCGIGWSKLANNGPFIRTADYPRTMARLLPAVLTQDFKVKMALEARRLDINHDGRITADEYRKACN